MSFPQGGASTGSRQLWDYTYNQNNFYNASLNVPISSSVAIITLTGRGIVTNIQAVLPSATASALLTLSIDGGPDIDQAAIVTTSANRPTLIGYYQNSNSTSAGGPSFTFLDVAIKFKSSFVVKVKNVSTGAAASGNCAVSMTYYT